MNRLNHIATTLLLGTCLASPAALAVPIDQTDDVAGEAADTTSVDDVTKNDQEVAEAATSGSIPEILSKSRRATTGRVSSESDSEVRLDFGAPDIPPSIDFLVFHEAQPDVDNEDKKEFGWRTDADGNFTPRSGLSENTSSGFLAPGEVGLLSTFTPRSANAHLSLSFGPEDDDQAYKRLGIELSSSIAVQPIRIPGGSASPSLSDALNRQEYNLGVNIGYAGFNLGASFKREYDEFSDGFEGFDVGLGYRGNSWSTSLSVGEYRRRDDDLLGMAALPIDPDSDFYALDFGASYSFSRAFSLTGGFRHFEYGRNYRVDLDGVERSQIFYLGTRLNF